MALNAGQSAPPLIPVVSKRLRTPLGASMCDHLLFRSSGCTFDGADDATNVVTDGGDGCSQSAIALDLLNVWVADVQGLGALCAVYMTSKQEGLGWSLKSTGYVMTVMGFTGVLASPFVGNYVDKTTRKLSAIGGCLCITCVTYVALASTTSPMLVTLALIVQGLAGSIYGPGVNSVSVGLVGHSRFPARCARNEVSKHIGAIIAALLPIALVDKVGYTGYFWAVAAMSACAVSSTAAIKSTDIDHLEACGSARSTTVERALPDDGDRTRAIATAAEAWTTTQAVCRLQILLFCCAVFLFHFSNAAMLPTLGQKIELLSTHNATEVFLFHVKVDGTVGVSLSSLVGQVVMIPTALVAQWLVTQRWARRKRTLLLAFVLLPVRGAVYAMSNNIWVLLATQSLDGICNGIFGLVAALIMADRSVGTGRFSMLQGLLAMTVGTGASLSGGVTGAVAQDYGFSPAFWLLTATATTATIVLSLTLESDPTVTRVKFSQM